MQARMASGPSPEFGTHSWTQLRGEDDGSGMIRCHLSRLMGERKLRIADVARATGVNRNLLTLLYYERAKRIDFDSLVKLCRFFKCEVGEFLDLGSSSGSDRPRRRM